MPRIALQGPGEAAGRAITPALSYGRNKRPPSRTTRKAVHRRAEQGSGSAQRLDSPRSLHCQSLLSSPERPRIPPLLPPPRPPLHPPLRANGHQDAPQSSSPATDIPNASLSTLTLTRSTTLASHARLPPTLVPMRGDTGSRGVRPRRNPEPTREVVRSAKEGPEDCTRVHVPPHPQRPKHGSQYEDDDQATTRNGPRDGRERPHASGVPPPPSPPVLHSARVPTPHANTLARLRIPDRISTVPAHPLPPGNVTNLRN